MPLVNRGRVARRSCRPAGDVQCHDHRVVDGPSDEDISGVPTTDAARATGGRPGDARYFQRNLGDRLFPGPSNPMSNQRAQHIEGLLRPLAADMPTQSRRVRPSGTPTTDGGSRRTRGALEGSSSSAPEPSGVATPEDIAQIREILEQQNELLQAILASTVDTQTDARATAQNSRTFAWAGTAIALLTLVATVIALVAAIQAN